MFGVSSPISHLLLILISHVTLFHLLLPCSNFGDWDQPLSCSASHLAVDSMHLVCFILTNVSSVTVTMKSYPERDLGNDGEEGVTTEINKQTWCDLRD
jgi:hypothetical protein